MGHRHRGIGITTRKGFHRLGWEQRNGSGPSQAGSNRPSNISMGPSLQAGDSGTGKIRADLPTNVRTESQPKIISKHSTDHPKNLGQRSQSTSVKSQGESGFFLPSTTTPRLPHLSWFSKEPALSLVKGCALVRRYLGDFVFHSRLVTSALALDPRFVPSLCPGRGSRRSKYRQRRSRSRIGP